MVKYFDMDDFPGLLREAILGVHSFLYRRGLVDVSVDDMWRWVEEEDYESRNHRVRPLERRLMNIFQLSESVCSKDIVVDMCKVFMKPIFSLGRLYRDSIPTLSRLREMGFVTALISNTTWGSPAYLWREEVRRFGLDRFLDDMFFCRDVGWRKPARPIFIYALKKLGVVPSQCVFIGDDPRWDVLGPERVGIEAILINRSGSQLGFGERRISSLDELFGLL